MHQGDQQQQQIETCLSGDREVDEIRKKLTQ